MIELVLDHCPQVCSGFVIMEPDDIIKIATCIRDGHQHAAVLLVIQIFFRLNVILEEFSHLFDGWIGNIPPHRLVSCDDTLIIEDTVNIRYQID